MQNAKRLINAATADCIYIETVDKSNKDMCENRRHIHPIYSVHIHPAIDHMTSPHDRKAAIGFLPWLNQTLTELMHT